MAPSIGIVFKFHKSLDHVIRMGIAIIQTPEIRAWWGASVNNQLCDQAMDCEFWLADHRYILTKLKCQGCEAETYPCRETVIFKLTLTMFPSSHILTTETPPQVTPSTAPVGPSWKDKSCSVDLGQGFSTSLRRVASVSSPCVISASV